MPRYSTRSTTKAAQRKAAIATEPRTSQLSASSTAVTAVPPATALQGDDRSTGGNRKAFPPEAPCSPPSRAVNGRKPMSPRLPFPSMSDMALDSGQQWEEGKASLVTTKRAACCDRYATSAPHSYRAAGVKVGLDGGREGDRLRKRSRLTLSKRRSLHLQQQTSNGRAQSEPTTDSHSFQQPLRKSAGCIATCGIESPPNKGAVRVVREGPIAEARGITPSDTACRSPLTQHRPPAPPLFLPALPPFVGLENVGETCYVNTALQALAACRRVLVRNGGAFGGVGRGTESRRSEMGKRIESETGKEAKGKGEQAGGNRNVLVVLEKVLREMEAQNKALHQQQSEAFARQTAVQTSELPQKYSLEIPQAPDQMLPTSDAPSRGGHRSGVITPTALVELIREGCLREEHVTAGLAAGHARHGGRLGHPSALDGLGIGQACVSELLGKLIDLGVDTVITENEGGRTNDSPGGDGERTNGDCNRICSLARAFRGTLCTRTLCMECERGRTSREFFTELTLPPLETRSKSVPQALANGMGAHGEVAERNTVCLSNWRRETRTIQKLLDAMLGRESLEGNNKVWCEVCQQWTEAERRSSLHSPPRLLTLHVRPGVRKQVSRYERACSAAAVAATSGDLKRPTGEGGEVEVGARGREWSDNKRKLIEPVLAVKSRCRCHLHNPLVVSDGNHGISSVSAENLPQSRADHRKGPSKDHINQHQQDAGDTDDVVYDLIGIILHQGENLGSGHYMFALQVANASCLVEDETLTHHHPFLPTGGISNTAANVVNAAPSQGGASEESSASALVRGLAVQAEAGESRRAVSGCKKTAFALFDDAVVRWLSPIEESTLLMGDGGHLGDPFLLFYARRP